MPPTALVPGVGAEGVADPPQERMRKTSSLAGSKPSEYDHTFWLNQSLAFSDCYPPRMEIDLAPVAGSEVLLDETLDNEAGAVDSTVGHLTELATIRVTHTPGT